MKLLDIQHESQSEIETSFQSVSHIIPQHLLSNSEEESKIILLRKVKRNLKKSLKNTFLSPLLRESKLIKRIKQRDIHELKHFIQWDTLQNK